MKYRRKERRHNNEKSPKQGLTSAKDLTTVLLGGRDCEN